MSARARACERGGERAVGAGVGGARHGQMPTMRARLGTAWHAGEVNALQGNLGPGILSHLLQYLAMQHAVGRLSVSSNGHLPGHVFLMGTRVTHIEVAGLQGIAALDEMMGWEHGRFAFQVGLTAPNATVDQPVQEVLLSLAIERDTRGEAVKVTGFGQNGAMDATELIDPGVVPGLVWAAVSVGGPIGEIFVDEACDAIGHHPRLIPEDQLGALVQEIARRFRSGMVREDFLTRAEAVLAHHGYGRVEE